MEILGAPLDALSITEAADEVERAIDSGGMLEHVSINAAKVVQLQHDSRLRDAVWRHGMATADGQPVVWAARLLGRALPERVAGIDLMEVLLERADRRGFNVYLLGARGDVLERAAAEIRRRYPGLTVVGMHDGYYAPHQEHEIIMRVADAKPHMLFIALPTPRKELFLTSARGALGVPFAMGVGGAFDVIAGMRRRAPRWAREAGLEWLIRLAQEPRRLGWRYVAGNARFLALVLREVASTRASHRQAA